MELEDVMRSTRFIFVLFLLSAGLLLAVESGWHTIHNDFYWLDQNGERVLTRSGCLTKFNDLFYWYGGNQAGGFREQHCYTSPDLVHWTSKGVVLRHDVNPTASMSCTIRRQSRCHGHEYDGNGAHLGIATADKPEGPFTFRARHL
jgi:hypothetical protein